MAPTNDELKMRVKTKELLPKIELSLSEYIGQIVRVGLW